MEGGRGPSYVESLTSDSHPIKDDRWTRPELMNPRGCKTLAPVSNCQKKRKRRVYSGRGLLRFADQSGHDCCLYTRPLNILFFRERVKRVYVNGLDRDRSRNPRDRLD